MMSIIETSWRPSRGRLLTRLRGKISADDAARWRESLLMALSRMPAKSRFSVIVDLRGYVPADPDVHARVRDILPSLRDAQNVVCTAVAHVTDEPSATPLGDRAFSDVDAAELWLASRSAD
jgi:hypothetical protein